MTRILLIAATPTKWDLEDRVVGNHSLPLAPQGRAAIEGLLGDLPPAVDALYHCKANEAAAEAAGIVAAKYGVKPKHHADLEEFNAGLWQGMRREEIRFRYPSVTETWDKQPLAVEPPEGETIPIATDRLRHALRAILRRNKGKTIAVLVRPIAQQILAGLLGREPLEQICQHLQERVPLETIELSDDQVRAILA
jgi:broad specificity phosphatase PhoE